MAQQSGQIRPAQGFSRQGGGGVRAGAGTVSSARLLFPFDFSFRLSPLADRSAFQLRLRRVHHFLRGLAHSPAASPHVPRAGLAVPYFSANRLTWVTLLDQPPDCAVDPPVWIP